MKGKFITFEGCEGVGKSTQIEFLKNYLDANHIDYIVTREPGGTVIGEKIRGLLKDESLDFSDETELMLFEAARCENVKTVIMPALEKGKLVIADRFTDSTIAYQAYGRGISLDTVREANHFGSIGIKIDLTVFLDAKPFSNRKTGGAEDRLELAGNEFHERVYNGYKTIEKEESERFIAVKTQPEKDKTAELIINVLKERGII